MPGMCLACFHMINIDWVKGSFVIFNRQVFVCRPVLRASIRQGFKDISDMFYVGCKASTVKSAHGNIHSF